MKGYSQFCPMARAAEIVTERWTLIIVRNLMAGCETFTQVLKGAPGLSKTLLTERLRTLERYGIVERRASESHRGSTYHLTAVGYDLAPVLDALGMWGAKWLDLRADHLNPYSVLWDIAHVLPRDELPDERVVVHFDLTDRRQRNRFWLVLAPDGADVCDKDPGHPVDITVTCDSTSLVHWHLGWLPLAVATRDGRVTVTGSRARVRDFVTRWQGLSPLAHVRPERPDVRTLSVTR